MRAAAQAPLDPAGLLKRPDGKADMHVEIEDESGSEEGGSDGLSAYRPFWWQHPEWMGSDRPAGAGPVPAERPRPSEPPPAAESAAPPRSEAAIPTPVRTDAGVAAAEAVEISRAAKPEISAFVRAAAPETRLVSVSEPVPPPRPAAVPEEDPLLREADAVLGWLQTPEDRPIDVLTARLESLQGVIQRQTRDLTAARAEAARLAEEAARSREENTRLRSTLRSLVEAARLDRDRQQTVSQALNKLAESLPK